MPPQNKAKILYLDDLADYRDQVGGLLRESGYEVECFADADSVREAMRARADFDLAVLDMRLDERDENNRDGLLFAFELRDTFHRQFPIIILSMYIPTERELIQLTRPPYRFIFLEKGFINAKDYRGLITCIEAELPADVAVSLPYDNFDLLLSHVVNGVKVDVIDSPEGRCNETIPANLVMANVTESASTHITTPANHVDSPIFQGKIKERWVSCLARARSENRGLRLRIQTDDDDLRRIPWERLKVSGRWPALSHRTPLIRFVASDKRATTIETKGQLRILVLIGAPIEVADTPSLNLDNEKQLLQRALSPLLKANKAEIDWLGGQEILDKLQTKVRSWQPQAIHYLGHGVYDEIGHNHGLVIGDANNPRILNSEDLGVLIEDTSVQFVLLNACGTGNPVDGVAHELVKFGIPAAIGMNGDISDSAAIEFATAFYQAFVDYLPIELAITEGRKRLKTALIDSSMQWSSPILFMHADNGTLLNKKS